MVPLTSNYHMTYYQLQWVRILHLLELDLQKIEPSQVKEQFFKLDFISHLERAKNKLDLPQVKLEHLQVVRIQKDEYFEAYTKLIGSDKTYGFKLKVFKIDFNKDQLLVQLDQDLDDTSKGLSLRLYANCQYDLHFREDLFLERKIRYSRNGTKLSVKGFEMFSSPLYQIDYSENGFITKLKHEMGYHYQFSPSGKIEESGHCEYGPGIGEVKYLNCDHEVTHTDNWPKQVHFDEIE